MYNTDLPDRSELPSKKRLLLATLLAIVIAAILLVTIVLPAEYGIDPTKLGRLTGLTQMGEIKMALAREAEQDRTSVVSPAQPIQNAQPASTAPEPQPVANPQPSSSRKDETTITLKPGEGVEIKLDMAQGAKVAYEWTTSGGLVNHDTHADNPQINYHGYSKGQQMDRDAGELVAAFDGKHGWFWRNRSSGEVTITLKTEGQYTGIKRVA